MSDRYNPLLYLEYTFPMATVFEYSDTCISVVLLVRAGKHTVYVAVRIHSKRKHIQGQSN